MKILLVGEYSRLHNSLKEGLEALGHQVVLISTGDHFKKFPADIKLELKYQSGLMKYVKVALYNLFRIDIASKSIKGQFFKRQNELKGFDVVQLINESPFGLRPNTEMKLIDFLHRNNKKMFLLSCGTDYLSVRYALSDELPYTILKAFKDGTAPPSAFQYILKYTQESFKQLHQFVYDRIDGVIASDLDYHLPLVEHPKYLGLIANPVNTEKLKLASPEPHPPVRIFLGINRAGYHTKGIKYFEEALDKIRTKYKERVSIEIVENLPYEVYIQSYNKAHIILDQVLGQDQGYNALEAMAKGKVVFTGADKIFNEHYNLGEAVAVNALPDSDGIAESLEALIDNPDRISEIGERAREFILIEHDHKKVAQKYLDTWAGN